MQEVLDFCTEIFYNNSIIREFGRGLWESVALPVTVILIAAI